MLREFVAASGYGWLGAVSLTIFVGVFAAVVAHAFLGRDARRRMDELARLPFEDGEDAAAGPGRNGEPLP